MIEPTRQRALALVLAALGVVALASHRAPAAPARAPSPGARAAARAPAPLGAVALRDGRPLDLNRATAADLELLPRVGPALAARIVVARDARGGAFRSVEDLDDVPGIGEKTLARLRRYVIVGNPPLAPASRVR